jgi:hypothetical protein
MAVQQAEAKLVDSMMPLANVMVRLLLSLYTYSHKKNRSEILGRASPEVTLVLWILFYRKKLPSTQEIKFEALETRCTTKLWLT